MERASCFLDLFCMRREEVNVDDLRRIITCKDPDCPGIWERLISQKYGKFMLNIITRCIRYAINQTKDPYLDAVFIFFVCMGFETSVQRIITKQLQRAKMHTENVFFTQEFVKFARHAITILFRYPVTQDDACHVVGTCVSLLQVTWLTKSTYFATISTRFEVSMRDAEMKRRADDAKAKDALRLSNKAKRDRA